ncbi:MAG: 50S ribosomal protein L23 [Mycoplasmoidaceae bacterium]|nr:50S ribosomal protein L23 [Mycoplasmoidaceae bacterium]
MQLTNVILKPYLTEKSYSKRVEDKKKYAFIVNIKATKKDIELAFASIFDIEPEAVTTMIRKSVATRTGTMHPGYTKAFKIAYITLPNGKDIAISKEDFEAKAKQASANATVKADKPAAKEVAKPVAKEVKQETKVETSEKKTA